MKTRNRIAFLVLVVVNSWLIFSVGVVTLHAKLIWGAMGIEVSDFDFMDWTLRYGIIWPIACLLISVWGLVETFRGKQKEETLANAFLPLVLFEISLTGLHLLGIVMPSFNITYSFCG